jgi:hypothetical protein
MAYPLVCCIPLSLLSVSDSYALHSTAHLADDLLPYVVAIPHCVPGRPVGDHRVERPTLVEPEPPVDWPLPDAVRAYRLKPVGIRP